MNEYYDDIMSKISAKPQWFDENAVPRYCRFVPRRLANIYAKECALVLISCQACGAQFKVAFSKDLMNEVKYIMMFGEDRKMPTIADRIKNKTIHYGDPPNIGCCPAGPTMNCDDLKVLQYWKRDKFDWIRDKTLEIELESTPIGDKEGKDGL